MYNVQRNAHLIESFIILSYIYRSYMFQGQRVILRDLSLGSLYIKKVKQSHYRPEVLRGFQVVKVPRLRDNGPGWW